MKTIKQQESARRAEYMRKYQKNWQKKFREEHGMSYSEALALRKAMKLIAGVDSRKGTGE